MINLQISDRLSHLEERPIINKQLLENAAQRTLQQAGSNEDSIVSIVITDDAQLHELNNEFRQVDSATDVLAFPADEIDLDSGLPNIGDIIISYERAVSQASSAGHPVQRELTLLVIHGLLHLLGYDHANPEQKAQMWSLQEEILVLFDEETGSGSII